TFAAASLITPLLLGVTVGAVAADAVSGPRAPGTPFFTGYVAPWLTPFALSVGVFALVAFAFLAAVYLTLEAKDRELQEDFRRRALGSGLALSGAAVPAATWRVVVGALAVGAAVLLPSLYYLLRVFKGRLTA